MSTRTWFQNTQRLIVAVILSIAAGALMVACAGQGGGPASPSAASIASSAAKDDGTKGVICHATGSAGNPYVGVDVGIDTSTPITIFSNNGHLDANGSPTSGHEQDQYIGPDPPNQKQDCNCKTHPELPACPKA